jgi:hypothetical protein
MGAIRKSLLAQIRKAPGEWIRAHILDGALGVLYAHLPFAWISLAVAALTGLTSGLLTWSRHEPGIAIFVGVTSLLAVLCVALVATVLWDKYRTRPATSVPASGPDAAAVSTANIGGIPGKPTIFTHKVPIKYLRSDAEMLIPALRKMYGILFESVKDATSLIAPLKGVSRSNFHRSYIQIIFDTYKNINDFYFALRRDLGTVLKDNISFRNELSPFMEYESDTLRENMSNLSLLAKSIPADAFQQPDQWQVMIGLIEKIINEIQSGYVVRAAKLKLIDAKIKEINIDLNSGVTGGMT